MKNDFSIIVRKSKILPYLVMTKPELTLLSVLTAITGAYMAMKDSSQYIFLFHTFIGTVLVGGSAGVLNQFIERESDSLMKRTQDRPIPSGLVRPARALLFGCILGIAGICYLSLSTNWIAVLISILTLIIYLAVYTPLKKITPFATVIGSIPGAMPPLIGWTIVTGNLSLQAFSLFCILFFWQTPHFLSLAWIYRNDYSQSQNKLLVVIDSSSISASRQILIYSLALLPASLMPTMVGISGLTYFLGALVCSTGFLLIAFHLHTVRTNYAARRLFRLSPFYLLTLFILMML